MQTLDIVIIVIYFTLSLGIALFFSRRAGKSQEEFFLSGRKLPWWIAGTTMVATTFGADTPLAVTELVGTKGIAGNWLWWNMVAGTVLTVFFFARLWRRAGILTDVEFIEVRYSGKPAAFLRGFRALYLGIFMNVIIMGWVNVALAEVLKIIFDIPETQILPYIFGAMALVGIYSAVSGLWGIAFTDILQFIVAMAGCIILADVILDLPQIGGMAGLVAKLSPETISFFPKIGFTGSDVTTGVFTLTASAFLAHILVQWWASWYPGAEPGGGGYVAQRMMSAKDERHSQLATLWFSIAHYALRPWPWIIVALAALVLYPDLPASEKKAGFVLAMRDHLPAGLLGLMVAAFFAAYMSTISTHLNWGSSYLINDFYRRFINRDATEKHYVFASRIATLLMVIIASLLVLIIHSISGAWSFIIECGAGLGLVLILRWFWWRVNAWAEIVAMIVPFIAFPVSRFWLDLQFPQSLFFIVAVTTLSWIIAMVVAGPEKEEVLKAFYERVHPGGPGWKGYIKEGESTSLAPLILHWVLGVFLVYLSLFAIGKVVLQQYTSGLILSVIAVFDFFLLSFLLKKEYR